MNQRLDLIREVLLEKLKKAIPWYSIDDLIQEVADRTHGQFSQVATEINRLIKDNKIELVCHGNLPFLMLKPELYLVHSKFRDQFDGPSDNSPAA